MSQDLQSIRIQLEQSQTLSPEVKESIFGSLKKIEKELTILEFKLQRTEKVKKTTAVLLEETIEELEQKRKAVEETNAALNKSLNDLKAAQTQLIHAEKMASLGELTAGIAHEIQNPLNFVNNFSELNAELIAEMLDEIKEQNFSDAVELAKNISENEKKILLHGKRADEIVKSMLQHSRTSTGQKELTDINALCDEYLRLAYHGMRAKEKAFNAAIEIDFDKNLGEVSVIPQEIGRVLLNLITNAFHALSAKAHETADPNFQPKVTLQTKMISPSGGGKGEEKIQITISDNGPGIPSPIKNKIFQPFFTTKPTGQGTGLGLSLSYDIIKSHGGKLSVTTQENEGSEFTIELPAG